MYNTYFIQHYFIRNLYIYLCTSVNYQKYRNNVKPKQYNRYKYIIKTYTCVTFDFILIFNVLVKLFL